MLTLAIFLFLRIFCIFSKGCLSISSNEPCITCLSSHFENNYLIDLKIAATVKFNLLEDDCFLKDSKRLIRKIHVLNSQCPECFGADAVYTSLPEAFEEESKLAIKFIESQIIFLLQHGTHYVFLSDFSVIKPELFRRSIAEIVFKPLNPEFGNVNIALKTNFFYIFVSKSLTIANINFIGSDILITANTSECSSTTKKICCNSTSILDSKNPCYFDEDQFLFITNPEYKGLFNLEYLFDRAEFPTINLENSNFIDFWLFASTGGFSSIFSMAPFSGRLGIYDSYITGSYFPNGFAQFSNLMDDFYSNRISVMVSSEYGMNINNLEESFEFKNLKFIDYNKYFKKEKNRASIFNFIECKANILFDSIQFNNIINSNIVEIMKGSNKGSLYFNNLIFDELVETNILKIDNYVNNVSIISVVVNAITNSVSLISLTNVNSAKIENLKVSNLLFKTDIGVLTLINTNLNISNSAFENCTVISIIFQTRMTLAASNLNFKSISSISLSRSLIYMVDADLLDLHKSFFTGILTIFSLFYISNSGILKFTSILIESSSLFSIFYVEKTKMLSIYDLVAKNNSIQMIWKEDQSCDLTFITKSQLRNNIFLARLYYLKKAAPNTRILFDQVMISDNNFTSIGMITLLVGFINLQKLWAINNFCLNPLYRYMISFEEKVMVDFQNSYLENGGTLFKKEIYLALTDSVFVSFWTLNYAFLKNNVFVVTRLIELVSGFISGSPTGNKVEIVGNQFFTISTNPKFGYKAILIDSLKYLRLEDNLFFNSRCNSRTFSHSHGAVYISGSASYKYSKNDYIAYINNNTFHNSSCYYGGNMAVISYLKVVITNCFFQNSSSNYFGGSLALFSIPNLIMSNISTVVSVANEGGAFYFQNIFFSILTNISICDVISQKNGAISIKYAHSLDLNLYVGRNTTSMGNGGFMYVFGSNLNISNGKIEFSRAKEGGALFLHGGSNVNFENNSISETSAEEAGGISAYDVQNILIKNLKMDHLVGTVKGAAIVFSFIKKVILQDFIVESSFSNGVGVILCKAIDENGMIQINNMLCKSTQAKIGSCLYHLSAIPIEIVNLRIEGNGAYPLFFRWSFAIQINLRRVEVINCNTNSNLVFISGVNIDFKNLFFNRNSVQGSLIYAQFSTLTVKDSRFINNNSSALLCEDSIFKLENLKISNPNALYKLTFLFSTNSKGQIKNLTLINVESNNNILIKFDKGTLNMFEISCLNNVGRLLTLTKANLNFSNSYLYNVSTTDGTANNILYLNDDSNDYYLDIQRINVTCFQSISFQFNGRLMIFINNSSFEFAKRMIAQPTMTTAISASNVIELNIFNCVFINFTRNAVFLEVELNLNSSLKVISSVFLRNEGSLGGALFLQGNLQTLIKGNIFEGNQALSYKAPHFDLEGVGGCIFYQALNNNFDFKLFSNTFKDNYASKFVSLVFSQSKILSDSLNKFSENEENGDIISFPLKTKFRSNISQNIFNIVSGNSFDLKLELVDMFDRLIYFDNSTIFNSKILNKKVENTVIMENSIGYTKAGVITFKNFRVKTNPNSNFSIIISGLFLGLRSEFISEELLESEYSFYARECLRGEIILSDFSCYKCPQGSYSLIDPMIIEVKYQRCDICPNNADCLGGNIITPRSGFYRKNNMSRNVVPCINAGACLGSIDGTSLEVIHGRCQEGNSETLCFYCEFGYGRFDKQDFCRKCASISIQVYARLIIYGFFLIAYIFLNSYFAENFNTMQNNEKPNISTFTKFLVNHSQQASIIYLSSQTPVGTLATTLLQTLDYISFSNGTAISNDCLIQNFFFEKESFVILKEIFILVLPIIFCLLSFTFRNIIYFFLSFSNKFSHFSMKIPKTIPQIAKKVTLFFIISTIIFYPLILKACFNLFNCIKIDSDDIIMFLKDSPNMQCWGLTHTYYFIFIGLPGIIVWGILFPIFLICILRKNQSLIAQIATDHRGELIVGENFKQTRIGKIFFKNKKFPLEKCGSDSLISCSNASKNNILLHELKNKLANATSFRNIFSKFNFSNKQKIKKGKTNHVSSLLDNIKYNQTFMFFCRDYKDQFYYWESLIFFRKFFITFIFTLDESIPIESKTLITLLFLSLYINSAGKKLPYKKSICNRLEMISLYTLGITVFSNLIFASDTYIVLKIIFFVMTVLGNLIFYWIIGLKLTKIFKQKIQEKRIHNNKLGRQSIGKLNQVFNINFNVSKKILFI